MKNTIRLDSTHPDKARVEHFLNKVDEELQQIPFDARQLRGGGRTAAFKFSVKGREEYIIVILAESYADAVDIEAANVATTPAVQWTINGAVLFGVESVDQEASDRLLSFFAGRE